VEVVLTLVQTKQIRINIHKWSTTKNTVQTIQYTENTSIHITKTPTLQTEPKYSYYFHSFQTDIVLKYPPTQYVPGCNLLDWSSPGSETSNSPRSTKACSSYSIPPHVLMTWRLNSVPATICMEWHFNGRQASTLPTELLPSFAGKKKCRDNICTQ